VLYRKHRVAFAAFGIGLALLPVMANAYNFRIYVPGIRIPITQSTLVAYPGTYNAQNLPAQITSTLTVTLQNVGNDPFEFYSSYSTGTVAYFTAATDPDADGQLEWDASDSTCQPNGVLLKGQTCTLSIQAYLWNSTPSGTTYNRQLTVKGMDGVNYQQVTLVVPISISKR
jgi:hypothetical protein